jgi:hypothetical protein
MDCGGIQDFYFGKARHGMARQGPAWCGGARQGKGAMRSNGVMILGSSPHNLGINNSWHL